MVLAWEKAGMQGFIRNADYYTTEESPDMKIVGIEDVEPPIREMGFRDEESIIAVLRMMRTGEALPAITVWSKNHTKKYKVRHGYHRFYSSVAIGYPKLPIRVADLTIQDIVRGERQQ